MTISDHRRYFAIIRDQVLRKYGKVVGETNGAPMVVLEPPPPAAAGIEIQIEEF